MIVTLALWILLFGTGMTAMLYLSAHKTIVIADVTQDPEGIVRDTEQDGKELRLAQIADRPGALEIPLPADVKAENLIMENRYMDRELWIHIQCKDTKFYDNASVSADLSAVLRGRYEEQPDGVLLKFNMDTVKEYHSTMEGNILRVEGFLPKELYSYVVVVDPAGGGSEKGFCGYGYEEKELALQIARQVQKDVDLPDVKLYLTRLDDTEVSREERLSLIQAVDADLYLGIGAAQEPSDVNRYGIQCYYNEEFFIPDFGNADLADITTRAVTIAANNRALGLIPADEDSILAQIQIPAAQISVGFLSNEQERGLLQQEVYQEKLAGGILDAIEESCERIARLREREEE